MDIRQQFDQEPPQQHDCNGAKSSQKAGIGPCSSGAAGAGAAGTRNGVCASRHMAAEQRRRARINDRLDALRQLVPHSDRANTAVFLSEVYDYIKRLHQQLDRVGCIRPPLVGHGAASAVCPAASKLPGRGVQRKRSRDSDESEVETESDGPIHLDLNSKLASSMHASAVSSLDGSIGQMAYPYYTSLSNPGPGEESSRTGISSALTSADVMGARVTFEQASSSHYPEECEPQISLSLSLSSQPSQPSRLPAPAMPVCLDLLPPAAILQQGPAPSTMPIFDPAMAVHLFKNPMVMTGPSPDFAASKKRRAGSAMVEMCGLSSRGGGGGGGGVLHRPIALKPQR